MRSEDRVELICMTVSGVRIVLAALCAAGLLAHLVLRLLERL